MKPWKARLGSWVTLLRVRVFDGGGRSAGIEKGCVFLCRRPRRFAVGEVFVTTIIVVNLVIDVVHLDGFRRRIDKGPEIFEDVRAELCDREKSATSSLSLGQQG